MSILTEEGKDAVDGLQTAVEKIEEAVRERIEDAINALDRFGPVVSWAHAGPDRVPDAVMESERDGDYLDRGAVLAALKRGAW